MAGPVCVVVGVGPGIGDALARRFTREGWRVALIARSTDHILPLATELDGAPYTCDVTDTDALRTTFGRIREEVGPVHTLLWNVGSGVWGDLDAVDEDALELSWRTNTLGLFTAVKASIGDMRARGSGKILITGATASRRGKPGTLAFAAGKSAQRSLAQSLARQLWPEGVHVALVVVDGVVDLPRTRERMPDKPDAFFVRPSEVATTFVHLARQPRSAWTFELEVRPFGESW